VDTWVRVDLATEDGTAFRYMDYAPVDRTVAFAPGQTTLNHTLYVNGDWIGEPDEWFGVRLSNAVGADIADDLGIVTIRNDDGAFLTAAAAPVEDRSVPPLTEEMLAPIVDAALDRWSEVVAGEQDKLALLDRVDVQVADFTGLTLGVADRTSILIDSDAAGWGWYVDQTPYDDTEFTMVGGDDDDQMDLLTTVMHEIGHVLGYEDEPAGSEALMSELLDTGERYLPGGRSLVVMDTSELEEEESPESPTADMRTENLWLLDFLTGGKRKGYNPFDPLEEIQILIKDEDDASM
jgi:hypothetical protein